MSKFSLIKMIGATSVALACLGAKASPGGVGGATEVTQIANNVELVAQVGQQIKTVNQLIQSYVIHYKSLKEHIMAGLPIDPSEVIRTVNGVQMEINQLRAYSDSLQRAGSSTAQLKAILDTRNVEASIKGLTFQNYVAAERAKILAGDKRSVQRLQTEEALTAKANEDLQNARDLSAKISDTAGVHEGVAQLNTHMNLMIQQNARMLQVLAYQTGTQDSDARKAADDQKEMVLKSNVNVNEAYQTTRQRQMRALGVTE